MLNIIYGDMFKSGAKVLAQGCNVEGRMGAGIAVQFRLRFPSMFRQYEKWCKTHTNLEGTTWLWVNPDTSKQSVACMFTQFGYKADMALISSAMSDLKSQLITSNLRSVVFPAIGCGIARTSKISIEKVTKVIQSTFDDSDIETTLCLLI